MNLKLSKLNDVVADVLTKYESTRVNDFLLYVKVAQVLGIDIDQSLLEFAKTSFEKCPPSFESVTRARRNFATNNPELFNEWINNIRKNEQYKYWKFHK